MYTYPEKLLNIAIKAADVKEDIVRASISLMDGGWVCLIKTKSMSENQGSLQIWMEMDGRVKNVVK